MHRIFLAGHDSAQRKWCRLHLEAQGLVVATFDNVRPALEAARLELPDLLVISVDVPGGGAYALAAALRSNVRTALIPILFLVPNGDPEAFASAICIEPQGVVTMPTTRAALLDAVQL